MRKLVLKWDIFPKFDDDVRQRTNSGGCIAIVALFSMVSLFIIRFTSWMTIPPKQKFIVNSQNLPLSNERVIDTENLPKMDINFDVTTYNVPCSYLHVDVYDNIKEEDEYVESHIKMIRLDQKGNLINKKMYPKSTVKVPEGYCGSCYGQKEGCCNTCKEVRKAFKAHSKPLPPIVTIEQCVNEGYLDELKAMINESCRLKGTLKVNRAPGVFNIAPGSCKEERHEHRNYYEDIGVNISNLNLSHTINHLTFGIPPPNAYNALDNHREIQTNVGRMKMYYYLRVVPIGSDGKTFQFGGSSYQNYRGSESKKYPGIFFSYDISPIGVTFIPKDSFVDVLTEMMSILGGIFAIATFVDAMLFRCSPEDSLPKGE